MAARCSTTAPWIALVLLAACGREPPPPDAPITAPTAAVAAATPEGPEAESGTAPPAPVAPPPAEPAELPQTCAELVASYERCIDDHFPEAGRELLREALAESRAQWQQAAQEATTEATRRQLEAACRQSKAALQTQMAGYGCIL